MSFDMLEGLTEQYQGGFSLLILSCKLGERIVLPGIDTTVEVIAIKGKVARLGILAPVQIAVHRAEVGKALGLLTRKVGAADEQEHYTRHKQL